MTFFIVAFAALCYVLYSINKENENCSFAPEVTQDDKRICAANFSTKIDYNGCLERLGYKKTCSVSSN